MSDSSHDIVDADTDTDRTAEEAQILQAIIGGLAPLCRESRQRILHTVTTFFGIAGVPVVMGPREAPLGSADRVMGTPFSIRSDVSPKQFVFEKQPRTDVERVACLAYYLTHFRDTPHFKTADISALNTEAAQSRFSNAADAVNNATKQGYLVPATKGNKQLSAAGEQFVLALPDRDSARQALTNARPRRGRTGKRQNNSGGTSDADGAK